MKKPKPEELSGLIIREDDTFQIKMNRLYLTLHTIQRLMPEVEAELFRMSRVGVAHGKKPLKSNEEMEMRIRKKFNSTTKIKT